MKTGFTTLAGRCFVSFAQQDGHTYGLVVLGSDMNNIYRECAAILDWAFSSFSDRQLVDTETVLTTIPLTNHNWISTIDNRLIRRMVRDYKYRANSVQDTIARWMSVRRGEDKWIFPFQENADVMFNSALIFELAVLKTYIMPLLQEVPKDSPEYTEANRIMRLLTCIKPMSNRDLPSTSLLREFLGGSSFKY